MQIIGGPNPNSPVCIVSLVNDLRADNTNGTADDGMATAEDVCGFCASSAMSAMIKTCHSTGIKFYFSPPSSNQQRVDSFFHVELFRHFSRKIRKLFVFDLAPNR